MQKKLARTAFFAVCAVLLSAVALFIVQRKCFPSSPEPKTNPYLSQIKTGITGRVLGHGDTIVLRCLGLGSGDIPKYPIANISILVMPKSQYDNLLKSQKRFLANPLRQKESLAPPALSILTDKDGYFHIGLSSGLYAVCFLDSRNQDNCVEITVSDNEVIEVDAHDSFGRLGIRCVKENTCRELEPPKIFQTTGSIELVILETQTPTPSESGSIRISPTSGWYSYSYADGRSDEQLLNTDWFEELTNIIKENDFFSLENGVDVYDRLYGLDQGRSLYSLTVGMLSPEGGTISRTVSCYAQQCPVGFRHIQNKIEELKNQKRNLHLKTGQLQSVRSTSFTNRIWEKHPLAGTLTKSNLALIRRGMLA